jgi:DNA invertase Pin-like site-specific DNA recombinase
MKPRRAKNGIGIFYTRDSGGRHETTPARYVEAAISKALELGVAFSPTTEDIELMYQQRLSVCGDAYFDHDISGNTTSRPALDEMFDRIKNDLSISHVFIPSRDRLSRESDPRRAIVHETKLTQMGMTIVFGDLVVGPTGVGQRTDIGAIISQIVDYEQAGEFRRQLADKMVRSQVTLAKQGFSTGGRPPYGFRRYHSNPATHEVTLMSDGDRAPRGYHVTWRPGPEEELEVIRRIVKMIVRIPANQVAKKLTEEAVLSPNAGRTRTDSGYLHMTSGTWNRTTIVSILKNPLLRGEKQYGRRSMGDQSRMTPNGPRQLTEDDFDEYGRPRVIQNDPENVITADAGFDPIVDIEELNRALRAHAKRAEHQTDAPRHLKGKDNPLSRKIFCMNCGEPMYRGQKKNTYRYRCSRYENTHAKECNHNHVDGPTATQFALNSIGQLIHMQGLEQELRGHMKELARQEMNSNASGPATQLNNRLQQLNDHRQQIATKLPWAIVEESFTILETELVEISNQIADVTDELSMLNVAQPRIQNIDYEVDKALAGLSNLESRIRGTDARDDVVDIFNTLKLRMYIGFEQVPHDERSRCQVSRGVITIGDVPPPIEIYPAVGSGHHQVKRTKDVENTKNDPELNEVINPEEGVSGKKNGRYWT